MRGAYVALYLGAIAFGAIVFAEKGFGAWLAWAGAFTLGFAQCWVQREIEIRQKEKR